MVDHEELNKKNLSVRTVAQLLQTNEETVRRWIREGKLQAEISSKKKGYTISADQLAEFLKTAATCSAVGYVVPTLLGKVFSPFNTITGAGITVAATALTSIWQKDKKQSEEVNINNESLSDFLEQQVRKTLEKISSIESQMMAVKAKVEAYHSVMQKNDSLAETNPSTSQEPMAKYLTGQIETLLQNYSMMEQELRMAEEQLKAYQDSIQALDSIN